MPTKPLVIVTGAARGIGRATVVSLVRDLGAHVLAISRDRASLNALQLELGESNVEILSVDLASQEAPALVKKAVGSRRLNGLVNNAGLLLKKQLGQYSATDLQDLYTVNVFAPLLLAQALFPNLAGEPPGHIVHIASMGGFQDSIKFPGLAAYSSSKAALACLAQCLAEEGKEHSVRSNCLAIGSVATEMFAAAFPGFSSPMSPAHMGQYIASFTLDGHKLFNGKVLPVTTTTP